MPRHSSVSLICRSLYCVALACLANVPAGAQAFFPLADVRAGMHGIGRTIFAGDRVENFDVEILGVLRNAGPKQAIILARLSGGPLGHTGILQGMSGSPVYIDGKLLGAVALGFPFSKDPIAGIQPIEDMVASGRSGPKAEGAQPLGSLEGRWRFFARNRSSNHSAMDAAELETPFGRLTDLLTPVSFSGFTAGASQALASQFEALGFEPLQGSSAPAAGAAADEAHAGAAAALTPGSMISVGLLTGDMNIAADGTVTYIDGRRLYAFGHRFLDAGSVEMPFARSEVITLIPNLNSSFKLSSEQQWIGTILSDRAAAISGEIGRAAHTVPLTISLDSGTTGAHTYKFQVVNDRFLTPLITQAALFAVLDATERTLGRGTVQLSGQVDWDGSVPPLTTKDTFVSDTQVAQQAAADAIVPLGFVLSAGFHDLHPKQISFRIRASEAKRQLRLTQAWTSAHDVRAGDTVEISAVLEGEDGAEIERSIRYRVPPGAPAGPLNFTLSDANTLNFPEFAGLSPTAAHTPRQLIQTINGFRDNDAVYIRVWRQEPSFTVTGPSSSGEISDPPPSVALILADPSNSVTSNAALTLTRGSEVAELTVPAHGFVISGAKTLQVEVKE